MKLEISLLFIFGVCLSVAKASTYPCNPAVHCPPESFECISRVARNGDRPKDFVVENQGQGFCTEVYFPQCTKGKNGECVIKNPATDFSRFPFAKAQSRCRTLLVPRNRVKQVPWHRYNSACPAGKYTCFDGSCAEKPRACNLRCKQKKCVKTPVRYGPQRCEEDCRRNPDDPALSVCQIDGNNTIDVVTLHGNIIVPEPEIPDPSDVCCATRAYNLTLPGFDIDFGEYEGGACCSVDQAEDFSETPKDNFEEPSEPGDYNIYPVTDTVENREIEKLTLSIDFEEVTEDNGCCCNLLCTCAGDPHCTSFDGTQAVSRDEEATLNMFTEGEFAVHIVNGFRGIIVEVIFTLPGESCQWGLKTDNAVLGKWTKYCQGESPVDVPSEEAPWALTSNVDFDSMCYCGDNKGCSNAGGFIRVGTLAEVSIFLRRFPQKKAPGIPEIGLQKGFVYRFDVEIKRFHTGKQSNNQCCPGPAEGFAILTDLVKDEVSGYCWEASGQESVEYFSNDGIIFDGNKRLLGMETRALIAKNNNQQSNNQAAERQMYEAVDELLHAQMEGYTRNADKRTSMQQAVNDFLDFGTEGTKGLKASVSTSKCSCINSGDIDCAPGFNMPLSPCVSGIHMEARKKGTSDAWTFVRSLKANKNYCDGRVVLDFKNYDYAFFYKGETTALDPSLFDVRFIERLDIPASCNKCRPREAVENLQYSIAYGDKTIEIGGNNNEIICSVPETDGCRFCKEVGILGPGR